MLQKHPPAHTTGAEDEEQCHLKTLQCVRFGHTQRYTVYIRLPFGESPICQMSCTILKGLDPHPQTKAIVNYTLIENIQMDIKWFGIGTLRIFLTPFPSL